MKLVKDWFCFSFKAALLAFCLLSMWFFQYQAVGIIDAGGKMLIESFRLNDEVASPEFSRHSIASLYTAFQTRGVRHHQYGYAVCVDCNTAQCN